GGKDIGYDYSSLFSFLPSSHVVHTVLYGENRFKLLDAALKAGYEKITLCTSFETAVKLSQMIATSGQTVLLSPASASCDEFSGYEELGERFAQIVQEFAVLFEKEEVKEEILQENEQLSIEGFQQEKAVVEEDEGEE
ncbi:MAG: hypothetical protein IJV80_01120, partial [Clostridia bacterium]|nr:hypothetical protein [Clostridia bacterium]